MKFLRLSVFILSLLLIACGQAFNPAAGNRLNKFAYFITTEPLVVKKILVPTGAKLIYDRRSSEEGRQNKKMNEERLEMIILPADKTIDWGGVPVTSIAKFPNDVIHGLTVVANFSHISNYKKTKFSNLWQSCSTDLVIALKNLDDWSFNTKNISDVEICSDNYQRYFKKDANQQKFLDEIFAELMKINSQ